MASDFSPAPIVARHWSSIGGARWWNAAGPVIAGGVAWNVDGHVSQTTGVACLTVSGLLSAFFLQLSVQAWDRASAWAETAPTPSTATTDHGRLLVTMAANSAYGTLVAFLTATIGLAASITKNGKPEHILSTLLAVGLVHVGFTLFLLSVRTFHVARHRVELATAGEISREAEHPTSY